MHLQKQSSIPFLQLIRINAAFLPMLLVITVFSGWRQQPQSSMSLMALRAVLGSLLSLQPNTRVKISCIHSMKTLITSGTFVTSLRCLIRNLHPKGTMRLEGTGCM